MMDRDEQIVATVVEAMAEAKRDQGMTTVELARRFSKVAGLGDLQPTTLNNLLAKRRKALTVGELIGFSVILGLDPLKLVPDLGVAEHNARRELREDLVQLITDRIG